ncbi:MAG: glutamate--cysteine ligase [Halioglobus sp.]
MGLEIDRTAFDAEDFALFRERLSDNLAVLAGMLDSPGFGQTAGSLGAELEMYVVDASGQPLYKNEEILAAAGDPQLTLEINRYNLEYNLSPYALSEQPFAATEREILQKLSELRAVSGEVGGRVVPIGILPTLQISDFGPHCVTDRRRYHALVQQLIARRGSAFKVDINGADPLQLEMEDITLEGANTSFQVHYRVNPAEYADTFNAIQLMTPLAMAIGANSPTLFGHSLWQETRVPLFKQSIDTRHVDRYSWNEPARVNFGHGWVRGGALELFQEVVRLYPPLLPVCGDDSASTQQSQGITPDLAELRLHQSTVWLWNRPIFDHADGGQVRIEMRGLPAGPTAVDMVANAAFLIGLAEGVKPYINELLPALPFSTAEYNFYRAAQYGLSAKLIWPDRQQSGCAERSAGQVIEESLPIAQAGLDAIGIDTAESQRYLNVIQARLETGTNGATWQLQSLARHNAGNDTRQASRLMLEEYMVNSEANVPVAQWPL